MNIVAPDGYRYGVMFSDGSVAEKWNGRSQRDRAREYLADCTRRCPNDVITLARRRDEGEWERCDSDGSPVQCRECRQVGRHKLSCSRL